MENNHMAMWLEDIDIETTILGHTPKEVRAAYEDTNDDTSKAYSPKLLNEQLRSMGVGLGKKKVDGMVRRVYMRQGDTAQDLFGVSS